MEDLFISIKNLSLILLVLVPFTAKPQQLPTIQKNSLSAHDLLKVDGKVDGKVEEWNNKFEAYNKRTGIFYTMANTKDKLYLGIQVSDATIIDKILAGGITFTISNVDKKTKNTPVKITFPLVSTKDRSSIMHKIKDPEIKLDRELSSINNKLVISSKLIEVIGIADVPDTLISVYNEEEIKTMALFDSNKKYTYEITLPIKYIQPLLNNEGKFKYNIKLNGLRPGAMTMQINGKSVNQNSQEASDLLAIVSSSGNIAAASRNPSTGTTVISKYNPLQDLLNPTDFSGTYVISR